MNRPHYPALVAAVLCLLSSAPPAVAGEPEAAAHPGLLARERLSGDWWGLRSDLEARGLTIDAAYVAEFSTVAAGGINARGSFRNALSVDLTLDLDAAFEVSGGTVFAQFLSVDADTGGSADSGDIQVYSNLEHDRSLDVIYELWYEQRLLNDRLRVKAGKIDANSEFARVDAADRFAHSSAGFSPTIFVFPSYPDPATAVALFATPFDDQTSSLTLGYGLFDGAAGADGVATGRRGPSTFFSDDLSDDYFHIAQAELILRRKAGAAAPAARFTLGAWHHDGTFDRFGGGTDTGVSGLFATAEWHAFDPDRDRPIGRGLHLFCQYGHADASVSAIARHIGVGAVWRGPFPDRADDSVGLYASLAVLSDKPAAGFDRDELALDAYYCVHLTPAVFVQPEIQYIVNPSGDPAVENALVLGLRVGLAF